MKTQTHYRIVSTTKGFYIQQLSFKVDLKRVRFLLLFHRHRVIKTEYWRTVPGPEKPNGKLMFKSITEAERFLKLLAVILDQVITIDYIK